VHFTPTFGSWLNLIKAFFSILTRQVLCAGEGLVAPGFPKV
jgi:hypothetical protein